MNNGINIYLISAPCLGGWLWKKVLTMKTAINDVAREEIRTTLIARFMGSTWGPSGADRTQVGPMLAPWTLLSGNTQFIWLHRIHICLTQRIVNTHNRQCCLQRHLYNETHIRHPRRMAWSKTKIIYGIKASHGNHITWALMRLDSATILLTYYLLCPTAFLGEQLRHHQYLHLCAFVQGTHWRPVVSCTRGQ